MLCYRDFTFCNSDCKEKCLDQITDEIIRKAKEAKLPISMTINKCGKFTERWVNIEKIKNQH